MELKEAIEEAKASKDRKFTQSIDLVVSLKEFDVKRAERIEEFIRLPNGKSKKNKICAIVGPELKEQAEKNVDKVIISDDLPKWTKKRDIQKLAREFDFFVAQVTIMPDVAKVFGKYFGPLGKMPNPKAGAVVPVTANIAPLVEKLRDTVKITISKSPISQCSIGNEKMDTKDLLENASKVLKVLEDKLPSGKQNIGKVFIKTTMGASIRVK